MIHLGEFTRKSAFLNISWENALLIEFIIESLLFFYFLRLLIQIVEHSFCERRKTFVVGSLPLVVLYMLFEVRLKFWNFSELTSRISPGLGSREDLRLIIWPSSSKMRVRGLASLVRLFVALLVCLKKILPLIKSRRVLTLKCSFYITFDIFSRLFLKALT